jgi:hypothetical protein
MTSPVGWFRCSREVLEKAELGMCKVELRECFINRFLRGYSPDTTVRFVNLLVGFVDLTTTFANLTVGFLRSTVKAVEQCLFTVSRIVLNYETLSEGESFKRLTLVQRRVHPKVVSDFIDKSE